MQLLAPKSSFLIQCLIQINRVLCNKGAASRVQLHFSFRFRGVWMAFLLFSDSLVLLVVDVVWIGIEAVYHQVVTNRPGFRPRINRK